MIGEKATLKVRRTWGSKRGFTLVELIVASAILLIVILVLFQVLAGMTSIWHKSSGDLSNFESARGAFTAINGDLARANLKTYVDYINDPAHNNAPFGEFRTSLTPLQQSTFVPYGYARASELHFICGPTTQVIPSGATAVNNPGDAVFFQAPLGLVAAATASSNKYLQNPLNDVGYFVQYSDLASSAFPGWLSTFFGGATHYRFRLIECEEPAENLSVYENETAKGNWNLSWIPNASATTFPPTGSSYNESVLAEDVVLLLFRPRLEPVDEQIAAGNVGATYNSSTQNSIISPNYVYDSRAWQIGYNYSASSVKSTAYALYMRNQLPPIIDVAMVCVDPNSLVRLQISSSPTPPAVLRPAAGLFANSANMDADIATFTQQLAASKIRFRVFRSSVQMQTAAWVNE
jgi:uncharacterized protein (TIGR02599 family)